MQFKAAAAANRKAQEGEAEGELEAGRKKGLRVCGAPRPGPFKPTVTVLPGSDVRYNDNHLETFKIKHVRNSLLVELCCSMCICMSAGSLGA